MRLRFTPGAATQIRKLHPDIKRRIRDGLRQLKADPQRGHALQFELAGLRSQRVGNYRIIYRIDNAKDWRWASPGRLRKPAGVVGRQEK